MMKGGDHPQDPVDAPAQNRQATAQPPAPAQPIHHSQFPSRREFLRQGASLVALAGTVPAFLAQTVQAAGRHSGARALRDGEKILVVLQLAGGNDGLNTVVPVTNDAYYRARPQLALPGRQTLKLDGDFALNGAAVDLKALYDTEHLAFVHAVGYPNPNRSHFKSMDIWHTASPEGRMHDGWLGRYFDNACGGEDCDSTAGIALAEESPLAMRGERFLPLAFERPESLTWHAAARPAPTGRAVTALNQPRPLDPPQPETNLEYLRRVALEARLSAEKIQWATRDDGARGGGRNTRGGALGRDLRTVARLIAAGMQTRVYYVSLGGFDTHANQLNRQSGLLRDLGTALMDFFNTLKAQGDLERVLVLSFSEFGRRVAENGSRGTDHGSGSVAFLAGAAVKGGLHGTPGDLDNLDRGDVRYTTDFRSLYATVLDGWLGVRSAQILGGEFPKLDVIARRR
ncbi:MAG TPA: DUF1501 domain-containing protein [Phycisphaerae bacterium]|nr:DUF1501 domain-containing protein [Phycisphaerales bacterium]HRX86652.1 DUF1501 domain-containing protein [Phycisphaerae bacterium]